MLYSTGLFKPVSDFGLPQHLLPVGITKRLKNFPNLNMIVLYNIYLLYLNDLNIYRVGSQHILLDAYALQSSLSAGNKI